MARLPAVKLVLWAMVAGCGRYHRTGNVVSAVTELLRGASWNLRGVPPALFRSPSERGVALLEVAVDRVSTERADGARSLSSGRAFGFVAAISWRPLRTDNSSSTRRNHEVIVRGEHGEDLFWGGGGLARCQVPADAGVWVARLAAPLFKLLWVSHTSRSQKERTGSAITSMMRRPEVSRPLSLP